MHYQLWYYKRTHRNYPVLRWIDSLDSKNQQRVLVRLDRVKEGNFGDFKNLGNGISELRFRFGGGYKIYFSILKEKVILLLCGGNKSTQNKDINKAKLYLKDYTNG